MYCKRLCSSLVKRYLVRSRGWPDIETRVRQRCSTGDNRSQREIPLIYGCHENKCDCQKWEPGRKHNQDNGWCWPDWNDQQYSSILHVDESGLDFRVCDLSSASSEREHTCAMCVQLIFHQLEPNVHAFDSMFNPTHVLRLR